MDLNTVRTILEPFVALTLYIIVSGVGVSAVTQALKDSRIPIPAKTYPRTTSAVGRSPSRRPGRGSDADKNHSGAQRPCPLLRPAHVTGSRQRRSLPTS